jgi:tRNA(adenine34) deaminase
LAIKGSHTPEPADTQKNQRNEHIYLNGIAQFSNINFTNNNMGLIKNNDKYYMKLALEEAKKALSLGEFPVGCVMVLGDQVLASGARKNSFGFNTNELDHAEIVTLRNLPSLKELDDSGNVRVYCTMEPCLMCYAALILAGIRRIVWAYEDIMGGGTQCDLRILPPLYAKSRISIVPYVCRQESLEIFKSFFSNPQHQYWKESLLAEYTLKQ